MPSNPARTSGLTVAITGPTGEIGKAVVGALERAPGVARIIGMARRPFAPLARGWEKGSYSPGDVLEGGALEGLVESAVAGGSKRLLHAASVAPYGFHRENHQPLTEDVPARGTASHYSSAQKAE